MFSPWSFAKIYAWLEFECQLLAFTCHNVTVWGWYWRVSFVNNDQGCKVMFLTNENKNHESCTKNNREYDEVELRYFMKNLFYLLIFILQLVFEL